MALDVHQPIQVERLLQRPPTRDLLWPWIRSTLRVEILSDAFERTVVCKVHSESGISVVRFPLDCGQASALQKEANITSHVQELVKIELPDISFFPQNEHRPALAVHRWIDGEPLTTEMYDALAETSKETLSDDIAGFLSTLHAVDLLEAARWCGITESDLAEQDPSAFGQPKWFDLNMRERVSQMVASSRDERVSSIAEQTLAEFERVAVTREQLVFAHGDVHGYNLAMRHAGGTYRLVGIFDFAIAGILDVHEDFFRLFFVSSDLVERVVRSYASKSGATGLPALQMLRIDSYWRAFLLYLMVEHLEAGAEARFQEYRQMLVEHGSNVD